MGYITYLDENEFNKKAKALRKYFMKNYKYLIFEFFPNLKREGKRDGTYQVKLPTCELFEKVYGPMLLLFSVRNDTAILEDILPDDILKECFNRELPTYKGVPYSTKKDFTKLKVMEKML